MKLLVSTLLIAVGFSPSVFSQGTGQTQAQVKSVSPQNLSESVNQIRVEFTTDMVKIGDVQANSDIFDVQCTPAQQGAARWNNSKMWLYDFKTKLSGNKVAGGTSCSVKAKGTLKSLAGQTVAGVTSFNFQIDGPSVLAISPRGNSDPAYPAEVVEDQVFSVVLDGPVDEASVLQNAKISVEGKASQIGVNIIGAPNRAAILKALDLEDVATVLLLQAKEKLPINAKATLTWGAGIVARDSGLARKKTNRKCQHRV